jgi:hypothetical protein
MMERAGQGRSESGEGFGGAGGFGVWLLIILFFIMFAGGNFGGYGSNNSAVNELSNEFLYTNLSSVLNQGFTQIANQSIALQGAVSNGFSQTQLGMMQGFNQLQAGITDARYASQQCCCEVERNIDALRYDGAKNTCDIITASNANTQRILDKMCETEVNRLRTELQSAQLVINNNNQTQQLISQLRPVTSPAYIVANPYCTCTATV